MHDRSVDLHLFGLNLSSVPAGERGALDLSWEEVARVLRSFAEWYPGAEAVVVRARNHVEAYIAAPVGSDVVRAWVIQLRQFHPELLDRRHRGRHYHAAGSPAVAHLFRLAAGRYAVPEARCDVYTGLKAALAVAARCGTLGETLDGLFVRALEPLHLARARGQSPDDSSS